MNNILTTIKHFICKILCIKQCQCLWKTKGDKQCKEKSKKRKKVNGSKFLTGKQKNLPPKLKAKIIKAKMKKAKA